MSKLFYIIALITVLQSTKMYGQGCKISISYDENGNRILRELVCSSAREAPDNPEQDSLDAISIMLPPFQEQIQTSSFKVYPNPTNGLVNIEVETEALKDRCSFVLSDVSGKVHLRKEITATRSRLSLAHLADGVYFLTLFRGDRQDVMKIVKEAGVVGF